jgi:hypothetical protein
MTEDDPLLQVLDRLTIDHQVRVPVEDAPDYIATHKGLIVQLREAVASDIGGGSNAGADPNTRVPINTDALVRYQAIEKAISARHNDLVGGPSGLYPENDLRWWYAAFVEALRAGRMNDQNYRDELHTLTRWETSILDGFEPPRTKELVGDACPHCGFDFYIDNRDKQDMRRKVALTITYREGDMERSTAQCGVCDEGRWYGLMGLRSLSHDLENVAPTS